MYVTLATCTVFSVATPHTVQTLHSKNSSKKNKARFARIVFFNGFLFVPVCTVFLLTLVPYCPDPSRAQHVHLFHRSLRSLWNRFPCFTRFGLYPKVVTSGARRLGVPLDLRDKAKAKKMVVFSLRCCAICKSSAMPCGYPTKTLRVIHASNMRKIILKCAFSSQRLI